VILGAGLLWYGLKGRHHIGTLASHAISGIDGVAQAKIAQREGVRPAPTVNS
jgi:hypothetical protein